MADGARIYLDTNVLIDMVEMSGRLVPGQMELLKDIDEGRRVAITSELSLAECLVGPLSAGDDARVATFESLLDGSGTIAVIPVDRNVLRTAAAARTRSRMRLPDAIHVATAIAGNCNTFLTADRGVRLPGGLHAVDWLAPDLW